LSAVSGAAVNSIWLLGERIAEPLGGGSCCKLLSPPARC
jgi:hypothetical protein